jgi:hypothetical protein
MIVSAVFTYMTSSSFVFQGRYGFSPQAHSVVFAVNAVGFVVGSQVSSRLLRRPSTRHPSRRRTSCPHGSRSRAGVVIALTMVLATWMYVRLVRPSHAEGALRSGRPRTLPRRRDIVDWPSSTFRDEMLETMLQR